MYVVDYRDAFGRRRWKTCETRKAAERELEKALGSSRRKKTPEVDPEITFEAYSEVWLEIAGASVKPRTLESYRQLLKHHVLPVFGKLKVTHIRRGAVKRFLARKLRSGLSRNTVRLLHATLRALFNQAIDDELIDRNPAHQLSRQLRLVASPRARQEQIKAMNREQLGRFVSAAEKAGIRWHGLFLTLARTGMRLGEGSGPAG